MRDFSQLQTTRFENLSRTEVRELASMTRYGDLLVVSGTRRVQELSKLYPQDRYVLLGEGGYATDNDALRQIAHTHTAAPVIALALPPELTAPQQPQRALYLDGVQDPGNVGTCIRLAAWFGCEVVYLSDGCAHPFAPKVVQASANTVFRIPIVVNAELPSVTCVGADLGGEWMPHEPSDSWCLVLGNEGHGIHEARKPHIHKWITIPSTGEAAPESLNVAQAAGVILARWRLP